MIIFRPPKESDLKQLLQYANGLVAEDAPILLNQKQTLKQEAQYLENILKKIKQKKLVKLLSFDKNKLIGSAQIEKGEYRASHVGTLGISVHKDYRNQGLGKQLIFRIINLAKQKLNITLVRLDVFECNIIARAFYKKLGFKSSGRLPQAIQFKGQLVDRIFMYKKI